MGHKPKKESTKDKRHWFFVLAYLHEEIKTWQLLKDFIRANLKRDRQPGWTVVEPESHVGYFSVSSASDARAVFFAFEKYYPRTLVHYYCITSDKPVEGPAGCNCNTIYRTDEHSEQNTRGWLDESLRHGWNQFEQWSSDAGETLPALSTAILPTVPVPEAISPGASGYAQTGYFPQMSAPALPVYPAAYPYIPVSTTVFAEPVQSYTPLYNQYASSSQGGITDNWGIPINAAEEEPVKTVYLGVIITNLHFKMRKKDLENVLAENGCGNFSDLKFKVDNRGQCDGKAFVMFFTPNDANNAANALDKLIWNGRPMKARVDKNRTPISLSSPPVVNGST